MKRQCSFEITEYVNWKSSFLRKVLGDHKLCFFGPRLNNNKNVKHFEFTFIRRMFFSSLDYGRLRPVTYVKSHPSNLQVSLFKQM